MAALVDEGLVRELGISEVTGEQLRIAHAVAPIAALQLEWSLAWREPEASVIPVARELGIGLVAYSPLGRGLLSADQASQDPAASPFRANDPRFAGHNLASNRAAPARLAELAARVGATPAALALAWLLAQGEDLIVIPGSRRPERVSENAWAASLTLDAATLGELDDISALFTGDRHSFAVPTLERPVRPR